MHVSELNDAGLFLLLSMLAWAGSIAVVWLIDRIWVSLSEDWADNDWYYRLDWISGFFNIVALVAVFNFIWQAVRYFTQ